MNKILINTNLITNFKPQILTNLKTVEFLSKNKKVSFSSKTDLRNQIYCKNFLIFLLLLKYKNNFFFKKSNIFIKKFKKKVFTILRSPYRHKLARHQISLNRYEINSSIFVLLRQPVLLKKWDYLLSFFFFIKSFNNIFESNIIFTNSIKISFPVVYKNNFTLKLF